MSSDSASHAAKPSAIVVDDHAFYRDGVIDLLDEFGIDVVAGVPNGRAALEVAERLRPDVVVLDLSMPGLSGLDVTRELRRQRPDTKVVMLTVSHDQENILSAVLAGVNAYVFKDGPIEEVASAIRAVARGDSYISPRVARQLTGQDEGTASASSLRLTKAEREVLTLISHGLTLDMAASALAVPVAELAGRVSAILEKLVVETRGDIAVRAMRDRIV